jgi:hypothetical protein
MTRVKILAVVLLCVHWASATEKSNFTFSVAYRDVTPVGRAVRWAIILPSHFRCPVGQRKQGGSACFCVC